MVVVLVAGAALSLLAALADCRSRNGHLTVAHHALTDNLPGRSPGKASAFPFGPYWFAQI
jgi:hypothetical protein